MRSVASVFFGVLAVEILAAIAFLAGYLLSSLFLSLAVQVVFGTVIAVVVNIAAGLFLAIPVAVATIVMIWFRPVADSSKRRRVSRFSPDPVGSQDPD